MITKSEFQQKLEAKIELLENLQYDDAGENEASYMNRIALLQDIIEDDSYFEKNIDIINSLVE